MTRPAFLSRGGLLTTHRPATETSGIRSGSISPAYLAGGTLVLLAGAATNAVLCAVCQEWAEASASAVSAVLLLVGYGAAARAVARRRDEDERKRRELATRRLVQQAHQRREELKAQLAAMHKNDPRHGRLQQELKASTYVVLGGGRA